MMDDNISTLPKPFVFVLMPFDSRFDDIYKFGIKGAADDIGAYAERIDEQIFSEGILDRIFNQISKADVVVADMTGRNPNVFYEVGYAHALGKVVILLTQNADDIPFDLKHRQHTVYRGKIDLLRKELAAKLKWAIAESQKPNRSVSSAKLYIEINGTEITSVMSPDDVPEIRVTASTNPFKLQMVIRNDSRERSPIISDAYLFTSEESLIAPHSFWGGGEPGESFIASPSDAIDGLTKQYHFVAATFPEIWPGGFKKLDLQLMLINNATKAQSNFRLRLHSWQQYFEYKFKINVELHLEGKSQDTKQNIAKKRKLKSK